MSLVVNVGLVYCEPPLNNQYGVPGNYAGGGNGHGTLTNSYGTPIGGGHDENQDYIDNQVTAVIRFDVYQTRNLS